MEKNNFYKILAVLVLAVTMFSSCKKESENIFTLFKGLKIEYKNTIASDEVYAEFKLLKPSTGAIMSKVILTETGSTTPVYTASIPFAQKFEYSSGVVILKTASAPQSVSYKITVLDDAGNDITSQVTISYPSGKLVEASPVLATDVGTQTFPEGSTVYLDYTITSADADIQTVNLYSFATGATDPADVIIATVPDATTDKRNFRGAVRVVLNRDGESRFRIYAKNTDDDYIGDGYTHVTTSVAAGYELIANRFVYSPNIPRTLPLLDSLTLGAKCFYSISRKKAYTYDEAKEISKDIDFGIYFTVNTVNGGYYANIYSMLDVANGNAIIAKYDLSAWTKRDTKYSSLIDGGLFSTTLVSGMSLKAEAAKYARFTTFKRVATITPGKMVYFLTPEGKNGAILFNSISRDFQKRWYVNFDVKIVK